MSTEQKVYKERKSRKGYSALAAAIIASGIRANDQAFLESDWFETLNTIVRISAGQADYAANNIQQIKRV